MGNRGTTRFAEDSDVWRNRSLQTKLLSLAGLCTFSLAALLVVVLILGQRGSAEAARECLEISSQRLDDSVRGVYSACTVQQESQQHTVDVTLKVAENLVRAGGG